MIVTFKMKHGSPSFVSYTTKSKNLHIVGFSKVYQITNGGIKVDICVIKGGQHINKSKIPMDILDSYECLDHLIKNYLV